MIVSFILDILSIIFLLGTISGFTYILLTYFKGMKKPTFWVYFIMGFIFVALYGVLQAIPQVTGQKILLSSVKLLGTAIMFLGIIQLLQSYRSRIKFDKKVKK